MTAASRKIILKEQSILWRAQLGHDWREAHQDNHMIEVERPFSKERMKPRPDRAFEGRANPKGIPCLYVSTKKETAMHEVRPWIESYISVAEFKPTRDLKIVDCSHNPSKHKFYFQEPSDLHKENAVWSDIDRAFAKPVVHDDGTASYAATQVIAESFKKESLDGIAYRSNFGKDGRNIALFDIDTMELICRGLYKADVIKMKFSEQCY